MSSRTGKAAALNLQLENFFQGSKFIFMEKVLGKIEREKGIFSREDFFIVLLFLHLIFC
jgi:hypothetical protein